jgi:hypothetical protein
LSQNLDFGISVWKHGPVNVPGEYNIASYELEEELPNSSILDIRFAVFCPFLLTRSRFFGKILQNLFTEVDMPTSVSDIITQLIHLCMQMANVTFNMISSVLLTMQESVSLISTQSSGGSREECPPVDFLVLVTATNSALPFGKGFEDLSQEAIRALAYNSPNVTLQPKSSVNLQF